MRRVVLRQIDAMGWAPRELWNAAREEWIEEQMRWYDPYRDLRRALRRLRRLILAEFLLRPLRWLRRLRTAIAIAALTALFKAVTPFVLDALKDYFPVLREEEDEGENHA